MTKKTMKFKAVYVLLVSFFLMILSIYVLTGDNNIYVQFVRLLQPSSSSGSAAAQQSQSSRNQTLPSTSSTSPSSSSATSSSLLPDVFKRVENSSSNNKYKVQS
jgi:hypothetical protein